VGKTGSAILKVWPYFDDAGAVVVALLVVGADVTGVVAATVVLAGDWGDGALVMALGAD